MKDKPDATIPSWDGSSRTWRRYVKEIGWYVGSTKSSQRKYAASKLISRLTVDRICKAVSHVLVAA